MENEVTQILEDLVAQALRAQDEEPDMVGAKSVVDTAVTNADRKLRVLFTGMNQSQWRVKKTTVVKNIINEYTQRMVAAEFDIVQGEAKMLGIKDGEMIKQIMLGVRNSQNVIEDCKRVIRTGEGLLLDYSKEEEKKSELKN